MIRLDFAMFLAVAFAGGLTATGTGYHPLVPVDDGLLRPSVELSGARIGPDAVNSNATTLAAASDGPSRSSAGLQQEPPPDPPSDGLSRPFEEPPPDPPDSTPTPQSPPD